MTLLMDFGISRIQSLSLRVVTRSLKSLNPQITYLVLRQLADRHDKNERIRVNPEICEIQNSSKALICMHISKIVFRKKRSIARYRLVIRIVQ